MLQIKNRMKAIQIGESIRYNGYRPKWGRQPGDVKIVFPGSFFTVLDQGYLFQSWNNEGYILSLGISTMSFLSSYYPNSWVFLLFEEKWTSNIKGNDGWSNKDLLHILHTL